jgi:hypothetical protein
MNGYIVIHKPIIIKPPNMRLQATAQLAAKNHAARLASLATPPQKCCIMEWLVAAASSARLKRLPLGNY